jgi:invasion protein IalB
MQMKQLTALVVAGAFALGAGTAFAGQSTKAAAKPAEAKKDDKAAAKDPNQFDDWRLQCQTPQGATAEVCELTQFAIMMNQGGQQPQGDGKGEPKGQLLLTVGVLKPNAAEAPRMILRAPLGVFLQPSPVIKVPGHKDVQVPFMRCDQSGCFSFPLSLAPEFVDAAKATDAAVTKDAKATNGTVTVAFQVNQAGQPGQLTNVTLPLSMKGFGKGLEALSKKAPAAPAAAAPAPAKKDGDKKK